MTKQHTLMYLVIFGALATNVVLALISAWYTQIGGLGGLWLVLAVRYQQAIHQEADPVPLAWLSFIAVLVFGLMVINIARIINY